MSKAQIKRMADAAQRRMEAYSAQLRQADPKGPLATKMFKPKPAGLLADHERKHVSPLGGKVW